MKCYFHLLLFPAPGCGNPLKSLPPSLFLLVLVHSLVIIHFVLSWLLNQNYIGLDLRCCCLVVVVIAKSTLVILSRKDRQTGTPSWPFLAVIVVSWLLNSLILLFFSSQVINKKNGTRISNSKPPGAAITKSQQFAGKWSHFGRWRRQFFCRRGRQRNAFGVRRFESTIGCEICRLREHVESFNSGQISAAYHEHFMPLRFVATAAAAETPRFA